MTAIFDNASFQNIVLTILACVVLGILVGCIYTFIRAIFFFIFAGSKDENKKKGWNSIRFMIIGLIMTVILLFLISPVLGLMNVSEHTVYSSRNVLSKAGDVLNYIFKLGNIVKKAQTNSEYRGDMYFDTNSSDNLQQPSSDGYQL